MLVGPIKEKRVLAVPNQEKKFNVTYALDGILLPFLLYKEHVIRTPHNDFDGGLFSEFQERLRTLSMLMRNSFE